MAELFIHELDSSGTDRSGYLAGVMVGDTLTVDDGESVIRVTVTGPPTDYGTYWGFPYDPDAITTEPSDEEDVVISVSPGAVAVLDTIPPPTPEILGAVTSSNVQQQDGSPSTAIAVPVGYSSPPVGLTDLAEYILQSTRFPLAADPTQPDWELATQWNVVAPDGTGVLSAVIAQPSVLAATKYWLRVYAVDALANRSGPSATTQHTTADDTEGPPQPTGIILLPGMSVFGIHWDSIEVPDLAYVEVRWAVPPGNWAYARVQGTTMVVTNVNNGFAYDVELRSVDTSGNTKDAAGVSYRVSDHPDDGWVDAGSVTPTAVPGNALVWDAAIIEDVFAGNINADWISAGTLRVGGGAGNAVAITVVDSSGNVLGRWSEDGIEIFDPDNDQYKMMLDEDGLVIWAGLGTPDAYEAVRITPVGIDAASITFGSARGGHNLVQNSSFELGAFGTSAVVANVWDLTADFTATRLGSDTNITISGGTTLGMTAI
jgi:hypothetical protein